MDLESILSKIDDWQNKWKNVQINENIIDVTNYFANSKSRLFSNSVKDGKKVYALAIQGKIDVSGMFSENEEDLLVGRLLCSSQRQERWSNEPPKKVMYQDTGTLLFRKDIPYARTHKPNQIREMMLENGYNPDKDLMVLFIGSEQELNEQIKEFINQVHVFQKNGRNAYLPENASKLGIPFHPQVASESSALKSYVHSQQPGWGTGCRDAFVW